MDSHLLGSLGIVSVALVGNVTAQAPRFSIDVHRLVPYREWINVPPAVGDIDGDGDQDLVHDRRVLMNNRSLFFREAPCSLPNSAGRIYMSALGDLDADGDQDLVRMAFGNGVQCWANDGTGCFGVTPRATFAAYYGQHLALGDVDGDLDLDILVARGDPYYGYTLPPTLLLNDGLGNFFDASAQINLGGWWVNFRAVALGDVDGDGDLDAYFRNECFDLDGYGCQPTSDILFRNDGSGGFTIATGAITTLAGAADPTLVDLDGDHDNDVFLPGMGWFANDGTGHFTSTTAGLPPLVPCARSAVGDFDGDGDVDALLVNFCSNVAEQSVAWLNDGSGAFSAVTDPLPPTWGFVTAFDAEHDGDLDLFSDASLLVNDGAAHFVEPAGTLPWLINSGFSMSAIGDVNGDRELDIVFGAVFGRERLFFGNGAGGWRDASVGLPDAADVTDSLALADIDNDGDLDLLTVEHDSNNASPHRLCLNDGHGVFTPAPQLWPVTGQMFGPLSIADVDSDGDLDVLTHPGLFFNDGAGNLALVPGTWPPQQVSASTFADLDGDGDLDVAQAGVEINWLRNDGSGSFAVVSGAFPPDMRYPAGQVLAGDIDGDGDVDLVAPTWQTPQARLLFANDGNGVFSDWPVPPPVHPHATRVLALTDFDADLDLDLIMSGSTDVLLNDGSGQFTAVGPLIPNVITAAYGGDAALDLDDDGDCDVLSQNYDGLPLVFTNLTRHLAWRTLPRIAHTMQLELNGPPDAEFLLLATHARAHVPFGPIGTLKLQRSSLALRRQGRLDSTGRALVPYDVPPDPALAGTSLYWQALIANPRRLTNLEITTFVGL